MVAVGMDQGPTPGLRFGHNMLRQRLALSKIFFVIVMANSCISAQSLAGTSQRWCWFQTCEGGTGVGIEVLLDGKLVYRSAFPACKTADVCSSPARKVLAFKFDGGHEFQGK